MPGGRGLPTHLAMVSTPSFTRSRSLLNVCIFMMEAATGSVEKCWGSEETRGSGSTVLGAWGPHWLSGRLSACTGSMSRTRRPLQMHCLS